MAGLDESCSHIGTTLFFIEAHVRIREAKTCTGEKAYWLLPNALVDVPYKPIKELDFTSSKSQKKKLDQKIELIELIQFLNSTKVSKRTLFPDHQNLK